MEQVRTALPIALTTPAAARRITAKAVAGWGPKEVEDVAVLLVSELVTNAVRHARSTCELVLDLRAGRLRVAVTDDGGGLPSVGPAPVAALSGRGLAIVDALALDWGVEKDGPLTTVWFELALEAQAARPNA